MIRVLTTLLLLTLLPACGGGAGGESSQTSGSPVAQSDDRDTDESTDSSVSEVAYSLSVLDTRFDQEAGELNAIIRLYDRINDKKMSDVSFNQLILTEDDQPVDTLIASAALTQLSPNFDYSFLVDVSSNVTQSQLADVKSLVETYSDQAIQSGAKVSIFTFSDKFNVQIRKTQNLVRVKEVLDGITLGGDRLLDEGLMKALKQSTADYVNGKPVQDVVIALTFGGDSVAGTDARAMNVLNKHAEAVLINLGTNIITGIPQSIPVVSKSISELSIQPNLTALVVAYAPKINTLYELSYSSEQESGNHTLKVKVTNDVSCSDTVGTEVKDIYFACVEEHELPFSMDNVSKTVLPEITVEGNHFGESTVSLTFASKHASIEPVYEVMKRDIFGGTGDIQVAGNKIELSIDPTKGELANAQIIIQDTANSLATQFNVSLGTGWPNYHQLASGDTRICVIKEEEYSAKLIVNCFDDTEGIGDGQPEGFLVNPTKVVVGRGANCAIDDNGVSCWQHGREPSKNDPISNVPNLTNVVSVSVADESACALDENGISCWGEYYSGDNQAMIPNFVAPTELQLFVRDYNSPMVCAKDEGVVKCGTWSQLSEYPSQEGELIAGMEMACFNSNGNLSCVDDLHPGSDARILERVPEGLSNVSDVSLRKQGGSGYCAINSGDVICWSSSLGTNKPMEAQINTPNLINPRRVVSTNTRACALTDQGMVCWGNYYVNTYNEVKTTVLHNPITMNINKYCAEDDSGVDCWGVNVDFKTNELRDNVANSHGLKHDYDFACAHVDGGMNCWGDRYNDVHIYNYYLRYGVKKIHHLLVGQNYSCYQMGGKFNCDVASRNSDYSVNTAHDLMETLPEFGNFESWDGGDNHLCAIDGGRVKCWGDDEFGQVSTFQDREATKVFTDINRTCIVNLSKELECAGATKATIL